MAMEQASRSVQLVLSQLSRAGDEKKTAKVQDWTQILGMGRI